MLVSCISAVVEWLGWRMNESSSILRCWWFCSCSQPGCNRLFLQLQLSLILVNPSFHFSRLILFHYFIFSLCKSSQMGTAREATKKASGYLQPYLDAPQHSPVCTAAEHTAAAHSSEGGRGHSDQSEDCNVVELSSDGSAALDIDGECWAPSSGSRIDRENPNIRTIFSYRDNQEIAGSTGSITACYSAQPLKHS